ncbi:BEN domain-containing protein 4-like [Paramormyrops kingsleyae]|uniref:BEN domain containing 4 n=1 Tax=Paramormyrops kingsleyae TaxID=1676925 RepID=A0A3B3T9I3_9TELE|nr:BEN domain-containing protein 4-like [Paramormyrops kingsleyae]
MQAADEEACIPKSSRYRSPYGVLKPFPDKRALGKTPFDRSTMVEVPPTAIQYPQPLSYYHHHQHRVHPDHPQPVERRQPQGRPHHGSAASAGHHAPRHPAGSAAVWQESTDGHRGLSAENQLILDAFAQQCSRVLSLLNHNSKFLEPRPPFPPPATSYIKQEDGWNTGVEKPADPCQPGRMGLRDVKGTGVGQEVEALHFSRKQQQMCTFLHAFTESLQSHITAGGASFPKAYRECCRPSNPQAISISPPHTLGGWASPSPSESHGHPSSTLPEEEEDEEACCPRCLELEQEVLCLQQENEELRRKLDSAPVPCQTVLDFFKSVLQYHNQFKHLAPPEDQLTEGSKQLLGNYPVFITSKQWDEAVNSSKKDGRRLLRHLIRFVFTTDELKYSCGLGKRKRSVQTGEAGPERRPLNPVKVTCLREFIRMHCASNLDWWMPSEEQINKVFSDAVGHARQGRAVGTFLGSGGGVGSTENGGAYLESADGLLTQDEPYLRGGSDGD